MTQTIRKSIGEGFAKGELYAALAYDTTDRFGGMKIKGISFNPVAGTPALQVGDSTTAWTALYTDKAISIYSTCASTNTGTTFEPVLFNTVMTGAGQVGGRVRVNLETDVRLGGWANALKASVDCKTNGYSTGLLSVICAEMYLPSGSAGAGLSCLELEMTCPASGFAGSASENSFIFLNSSGTTSTAFDDYGVFMHFQSGLVAGIGHLLSANSQTLKVGFGTNFSTGYRYLLMSQIENGLGLGVTGTHMTLTASTKAVDIYTTTVATASTVQAARINLVGAVGTVSTPSANLQALNTNVDVNVVTGSSITSIYAQMTYGASGDARGGMASTICAELKLPGKTLAVVGGSYCIADLEMWTPASYLSCTNNTAHITAFQRFAIWGNATAVNSFEDYGYLFNLNGFTSASGNLFYANTIRCIVGSTAWYLPLSTAEGSYTTAYPIVSTYAGTAFSSTNSLTGTSHVKAIDINITDATTQSSGYNASFFCQVTNTGAMGPTEYSAGRFNLIFKTGAKTGIYNAFKAKVGHDTAPTLTGATVNGIHVSMDEIGACTRLNAMMLETTNTTNTTNSAFFDLRSQGSGIMEAFAYHQGTNRPTYFWRDAQNISQGFCEAGDVTSGKTCSGGFRIKFGSTIYSIPFYPD